MSSSLRPVVDLTHDDDDDVTVVKLSSPTETVNGKEVVIVIDNDTKLPPVDDVYQRIKREFPHLHEEISRMIISQIMNDTAARPGEDYLDMIQQQFRTVILDQMQALDNAAMRVMRRKGCRIVFVEEDAGRPSASAYSFSTVFRKALHTSTPRLRPADLDLVTLHSRTPPENDWTFKTVKAPKYSMADSVGYVHRSDRRVHFFHGTSFQHLINMIETGVQPCGGPIMGRGFYITANPNTAMNYAARKGGNHENNPSVIIQFSMSLEHARSLEGCRYTRTITGLDFYQNGNPTQYDDFVLPSATSISKITMDNIYIYEVSENFLSWH